MNTVAKTLPRYQAIAEYVSDADDYTLQKAEGARYEAQVVGGESYTLRDQVTVQQLERALVYDRLQLTDREVAIVADVAEQLENGEITLRFAESYLDQCGWEINNARYVLAELGLARY